MTKFAAPPPLQLVRIMITPTRFLREADVVITGNIAVGNLHLFLPVIVKLVQNDKEKRLLALHAIKEVVSNCPVGQLEGVAETIWVPLFKESANSEESTRNIAAACLGKLTTTNPSRYLPQLQVRGQLLNRHFVFLKYFTGPNP